jgi:hypothetical protein
MQALEGKLAGFSLVLYPADRRRREFLIAFLLVSGLFLLSCYILYLSPSTPHPLRGLCGSFLQFATAGFCFLNRLLELKQNLSYSPPRAFLPPHNFFPPVVGLRRTTRLPNSVGLQPLRDLYDASVS